MSRRWVEKDLRRIRARWQRGHLDDAEITYLRAWAMVLLTSELELDDDDRARLQLFLKFVAVVEEDE